MKVFMVTGHVPAVRCGVEDYTIRLSRELPETDVAALSDWSLAGALSALRAARTARPGLVHIQYPALAYGASLGPHLLALLAAAPVIVTLHEFTAFRLPKRTSLIVFAVAARHLVFTTAHERNRFLKLFPWCRRKSSVVPIGSNIPFLPHDSAPGIRIAFFGQLRPERGLEACIDLARLARERGRSWRFLVIGGLNPEHRNYVAGLREQAAGLDLEWLVDLDPDAVARHLSRASAIYLPYPDGVSERRGTLIAALGNRGAIVTTDGPFRPAGIERVVRLANGPQAAFDAVADIIADPDAAGLRAAAARFARKYDWAAIGDDHRGLYAALAPEQGRAGARIARSEEPGIHAG